MTNHEIVVLVPHHGPLEPECEVSLRELERTGIEVRRLAGHPNIDMARNILATRAIADGFNWLMWIDSDIGFEPEDVLSLTQHDSAIVTGVYAKKGRRELACQLLPETDRVNFGDNGGLIEIRYAATGFLLTRRDVYETIQEKLELPTCNAETFVPQIPFFQPMLLKEDHRIRYLGDDFSFCERARQCGFRIWADTRIRLWHFGRHAFGWEDAGTPVVRYESFRFDITR